MPCTEKFEKEAAEMNKRSFKYAWGAFLSLAAGPLMQSELLVCVAPSIYVGHVPLAARSCVAASMYAPLIYLLTALPCNRHR